MCFLLIPIKHKLLTTGSFTSLGIRNFFLFLMPNNVKDPVQFFAEYHTHCFIFKISPLSLSPHFHLKTSVFKMALNRQYTQITRSLTRSRFLKNIPDFPFKKA